jgi:hypothetical protein
MQLISLIVLFFDSVPTVVGNSIKERKGEEKQKTNIKNEENPARKGSEYRENDDYEVTRITRNMGSKETVLGS